MNKRMFILAAVLSGLFILSSMFIPGCTKTSTSTDDTQTAQDNGSGDTTGDQSSSGDTSTGGTSSGDTSSSGTSGDDTSSSGDVSSGQTVEGSDAEDMVVEQMPKTMLDPASIPKFVTPLLIPPAMPKTDTLMSGGQEIDYYEIAIRQFEQYILPEQWSKDHGIAPTTVWGYGSVTYPGTVAEGGTFNYPSFTIEATYNQPVRVKWINDLVDEKGNYLPHLLPVDQTLHWANPPAGVTGVDTRGTNPDMYLGPVPMISHVHGAHTTEDSDGYPEAWYLPDANNIPAGYATVGTKYAEFKAEGEALNGVNWSTGNAVFQYPNDQRATTLWYHDHTLGMTRTNVYAGPAGFYNIRGGVDDVVMTDAGGPMVEAELPGPAPMLGDDGGPYYEIPIVIQDRSFNTDGSLFYPDNRAYFEDLEPEQLQIPFIPDEACDGEMSDISPIWTPEFFGNTVVVNGNTWPYLEVEQRQYRFRLLNGTQSRFLILKMEDGTDFWQIGSEGGFLPEPLMQEQLLIAPAERADVIIDFSDIPVGTNVVLENTAPDDPYGGGEEGVDYDRADEGTTGQVLQFRVVAASGTDMSTPASELVLPEITKFGDPDTIRQISLNEEESSTVFVEEEDEVVVLECEEGEPFAPRAALLGTVDMDDHEPMGIPLLWMDEITENPGVGDTEVWEIYNFTEDAHPIHVHLVQFQVVNRENRETGEVRPPEAWENGFKDTVIAYPGEITRIKARFDIAGLFVWHCHILEHEDNEMMRPYRVGP